MKVLIFERLKEERERLGFTQAAFGAIGGVSVRAQSNYEKGDRSPDTEYLASIAKVGADVQYVVTGVRGATLVGEEALLLEGFRKMDSETKRRTLAMVYGGTPPSPTISMTGDGTQIGTNTAPINIDMRKGSK